MSFDFGAEVVGGGSSFKNPSVGKHAARLRSIVHLGMQKQEFNGQPRSPAPMVAAIFELKDEDDRNDDGTPMSVTKEFALKKGDKAFLTKFMKALLTAEEKAQYDAGTLKGDLGMLIGRCCEVDLSPSKDKNEDGTPKYVNVSDVTALHAKLAAITDELEVAGVGHMPFAAMTKEGIRELSVYTVATKIKASLSYAGSQTEAVVKGIEAENPDAFKLKGKAKSADAPADPEAATTLPPADLKDDEEF